MLSAPFDVTESPAATVVAAYYGGWKDPVEPVITWQAASPWGVNATNRYYMGDYPERFPLYGAVNEDSQTVIDQHLTEAASVGIGVFAVNWYRDEFLSYAADRMAASSAASSVKWCLQWSNHYTSMSTTAGQLAYLLEGIRRAALRMNGARYWVKAGRPVLILFSTQHLDDVIRISTGQSVSYTPTLAERNALVANIRNVVGNVLAGDSTGGITGGTTVSASANPGPYLVLQGAGTGWPSVTGVDAITNYNVRSGVFAGASRLAHSFAELLATGRRAWASNKASADAAGIKAWPCLTSGWDSRPWGGTVSDALHDNCTPTDDEFRMACAEVRQFAATVGGDNTVFLYAWNELGEGGYVQPTAGSGTGRLNALRLLTNASAFADLP